MKTFYCNLKRTAFVCVAGCLFADVLWASIPAAAYVQDGLVALYDGIENAGAGQHDPQATAWKNLASGASDATLPAGKFTVNDKYILLSDVATVTGITCAQSNTVSLESCVRVPSASSLTGKSNANFININNRALFGYDGRNNNDRYMVVATADNHYYVQSTYKLYYDWLTDSSYNNKKFAETRRTWNAYLPAWGHNNQSVRVRMDGGAERSPTWSWGWTAGAQSLLVNGNGGIGCTVAYEIYCSRIYSRKLKDEEIAHNALMDSLRFGADGDRYFYEGGIVKALHSFSLGRHGRIRVDSGDPVSNATFKVGTEAVTVTPHPDAGYEFVSWQGDLNGRTPAADGTLALDNTNPVELKAIFKAIGASTRTWSGSVSTDWNDAANWSGAVPAVNDAVIIPAGKTAVLAVTTPVFESVEISGTVVMSNATACLKGALMTVKSGGTLTCAAAMTERSDISRVYVVCEDFTVVSGGFVDVAKKGYKAGANVAAAGAVGFGAAHGGCGGASNWGNRLAYDDAAEPTEPGAPGAGKNGGGIVRIEATGDVVVDGTINASGEDSGLYKSYHNWSIGTTGGAGGTVYILARTVSGSGSILAEGGGGNDPRNPRFNTTSSSGVEECERPGGGGRIAVWTGKVVWNPSVPSRRLVYGSTPVADEFLTFSGESSAAAGEMFLSRYDWGQKYDPPTDKDGAPGTVWFCRVKPARGLVIAIK